MIELNIKNDCIRCGRCVSACPAYILGQADKKAEITVTNLQICIECGQCVSICPTNSVEHSLFPQNTIHEVKSEITASSEALLELLRKRRSNRAFSDKQVPLEILNKILDAAHLAPTGGNRQNLEYTLVTDPEVLQLVCSKTIEVLDTIISQSEKNLIANPNKIEFLKKLSDSYKKGKDVILRDAKALILIHSTEANASIDANLAYQNASLMAETLNIAHFYTGYIRLLADQDAENLIAKSLNINGAIYAGMALSMPKYTFNKYVDRKPQIVNRILK